MVRGRKLTYLLLAFGMALAAVTVACGPSREEQLETARQEEWDWLQQTKDQLAGMREELGDLRARLEEAQAAEASGGRAEVAATGGTEAAATEAEAGPTAAELEQELAELEAEVGQLTEEFNRRLVKFINDNPVIKGQEPTERQLAAIRMKSDEDIVLAQEYIEKGGDYRRAIEIYETALAVDPDNEKLHQALEEARANRYMSEARFSRVEKGMSQRQVREVLGPVNLYNIKEYPDQDMVGWFYPKEGGGAAGVFFRRDARTGEHVVDYSKFDAVKSPAEEQADA